MKIVCAGGGTLGSVTPILAVLAELRQRGGISVDWFGTIIGPERELVTAAEYRFHPLPGGKWRRYLSVSNLTDIFRIIVSFGRALAWFMQNKADVLLTAGSFIAVPVGWAAWLAGVPVFVHQQDVRPGLANKLLAPVARRITVSLALSQKDFPAAKVVLTGNPVRAEFVRVVNQSEARQKFGLVAQGPVITVLGGGTGAQFLNDLVVACLPQLTKSAQVLHLTGANRGARLSVAPNYHPLEFTNDTAAALAAADVVITRAGMGTITELAALERAAIIVPIPNTHQEDNANLIDSAGAAVVLSQAALTPEVLLGTVSQLLNDPSARERVGKALANLLPQGAAARVANEVTELVKSK